MSKIKLHCFQCGVLKTTLSAIKLNQPPEPYEIPVPWYLIEHPEGNVVIDGGNAVEVHKNPHERWGAVADVYYPLMTEEDGCINQLDKYGIDPASVKYVLFSHLHLDHTGAAGRFPDATHIVQRKEYNYAMAPDWFAKAAYILADFTDPKIKWKFLDDWATDGFDLYGDGRIKAYFSPGHAVGHQSFLIALPNTGPILLTIDAAYTLDHWNEKALPGFMCSAIDTAHSVRRLKEIARSTKATVFTGHDPDNWKTVKQAPQFYD
jgi:N-acyl homoserine lactone hydrolase